MKKRFQAAPVRGIDPVRAEITDPDAREAAVRVQDTLAGAGRVGVAYSGGVDSSVLLALAVRSLGAGSVVAITGMSPSLAGRELRLARRVAALIGAPMLEVATDEGELPEYRANGLDRCFHCKDTLFSTIDDTLLERHRLDAVAYGETADDRVRTDRPGTVAATEHGVLRPLAEAGVGKGIIRTIAQELGLPNWDKAAAPCLASRIPHFSEVTPEKLAQVEAAEDALWELSFRDLRVRHYDDTASVELPPKDMVKLVSPEVRGEVIRRIRGAGFRRVVLDLEGLRSGSLFQIAGTGHERE